MATNADPTPEDAIKLFRAVEEKFPHETLGNDKWYLVVVSFLFSSRRGDRRES